MDYSSPMNYGTLPKHMPGKYQHLSNAQLNTSKTENSSMLSFEPSDNCISNTQNISDRFGHIDDANIVLDEIVRGLNAAEAANKKEGLDDVDPEMRNALIDHVMNGDDDSQQGCLTRLSELIQFVAGNKAESGLGRWACNVSNAVLRNVVSVMLPTLLRQIIAYGMENGFKAFGGQEAALRLFVAFLAASYPIVLNIGGAIVDHKNGSANTTSQFCRGFNVLIGLGAVIAACATGVLPSLAASLVAFNTFCVMRDINQLVVQLKDETGDVSLKAMMGGSVLYTLNQMAAGVAVTEFATPSGAGAAALQYGKTVQNDLGRSGINLIAETGDTLAFATLQHAAEGKDTRLTLEVGCPSKEQVKDAALGVHAGRTFFFTTGVLLAAVASTMTATYSDPVMRSYADNMITSILFGLFYNAFFITATRGKLASCNLL